MPMGNNQGYVYVDPYSYQSYMNWVNQQAQQQNRDASLMQMMNQQPQPNQNQPQTYRTIPARFASSYEEIKPNETPSDGTPALFLQSDYQCIYARAMNDKGTIDTVKYVPEKPAEPEPVQNDQESDIVARLERIEKMLERNNRPYYGQKKPYNKQNQPPVRPKEDKK